eukprot:236865-Amphidinium_carterae.1
MEGAKLSNGNCFAMSGSPILTSKQDFRYAVGRSSLVFPSMIWQENDSASSPMQGSICTSE